MRSIRLVDTKAVGNKFGSVLVRLRNILVLVVIFPIGKSLMFIIFRRNNQYTVILIDLQGFISCFTLTIGGTGILGDDHISIFLSKHWSYEFPHLSNCFYFLLLFRSVFLRFLFPYFEHNFQIERDVSVGAVLLEFAIQNF